MDDHELLREYVRDQSQEAFRQLVDRHLPMVYCAACRMVRDAHLAEEVAQNVFAAFARKAGSLNPPQIIGGWLYNTTRNLAMHAVRTEQRRREREQTAAAMHSLEANADTGRILEQLEPAMEELEAAERDVLVLRFLENRSLREVGGELGISEDAARMRVNRALEQLRLVFNRQKIGTTVVLLASALGAGSTSAVPAGLVATVTATALAGTITTTATHAVITTMSWINIKSVTAAIGAALLAGTGTYLVQQQQIKHLRDENSHLKAEAEQLKTANETALATIEAGQGEVQRLRQDIADLPRLRNEVSQLRQNVDEKRQADQTSARTARPANPGPGAYITQAQLANVGYATPEAAMQTITWAMMKGTYEQANASLSPEKLAAELKDPDGRKNFESGQMMMSRFMKGLQLVAKKTLADDKVELKVKMDMHPFPGPRQMPEFMVQPMMKLGSEWKMAGGDKPYEESWDQEGVIQILRE